MRTLPLLLFCLAALCLPARAERPVMIFSSSGYMPFFSAEAGDSQASYGGEGMLVDLLDAFEAAHPEYAFRRVLLPRARSNEWVAEGRAEAYALHSPAFLKAKDTAYVFTAALWTTADHIYVRADNALRWQLPEDLRGLRLGVIRGFGYGPLDPLLESGAIQAVPVQNDLQLYRLLLDGRVDAIVGNRHVLPHTFRREGLDLARVRPSGPPLYEFELASMVRKDRPELLRVLNRFYEKAHENGLLDAIELRWIGSAFP